MSKVTVHVERRAVCPRCGVVFAAMRIPAHSAPGGHRACPAVEQGARRNVVVFRRDGEEVASLDDGAELTGYFTADEDSPS